MASYDIELFNRNIIALPFLLLIEKNLYFIHRLFYNYHITIILLSHMTLHKALYLYIFAKYQSFVNYNIQNYCRKFNLLKILKILQIVYANMLQYLFRKIVCELFRYKIKREVLTFTIL